MKDKRSVFYPIRTKNDPVYDRNIVMISSKEKYVRKVLPNPFTIFSFPFSLVYNYNILFNPSEYLPPFIEINEARKTLGFPVGHPIDGNVYGTSEMDPNRYVPISSFHNDMYQSKLSFFIDMCSILGVKECTMTEMRQNGQIIKFNIGLAQNSGPTETEIENSFKRDSNSLLKMKGHFSFPKPKHKIEKIESKWLLTEQTWRKMQDIRIDRDISTFEIEFNVENDFGINSSTLAKFGGNKISLGGEFSEFTKTSYLYKIEFWEK
ncbi:hypothetical protein Belba_2060 [Belliella baltica DSM 15883]|uniref:Uncharacterized protein n=1 Tax=Belliella baltica (strain DSM 15883 / CIP 108006 / LMG 21964 / BA134) TaxID=866536 RepID=I3Z5W4_BELBD|nr:hypothetical protein [Belliella baltica]AFL84632.1 hypothetical protein Belba_2060 [Belliella baltica DSM 15883]